MATEEEAKQETEEHVRLKADHLEKELKAAGEKEGAERTAKLERLERGTRAAERAGENSGGANASCRGRS